MAPKVSDALICCLEGIDCDEFTCGFKGKGECCCCVGEQCFACGEESLGCCCVTNPDNGECCKIGIPCCTFGLKMPDKCCATAGKYEDEGYIQMKCSYLRHFY